MTKVPSGEQAIAFSGPATASNRFFVSITPMGVRIAFAEQANPTAPPAFRTAVVLSHNDGVELQKLLEELLLPHLQT